MSTNDPEITTFVMRAGEITRIQIDYSPSLAEGDSLAEVPTFTQTRIKGSGSSLTLGGGANEPGATPVRASVLITTTASQANTIYRVDATGTTANSERKIVPVLIKVVT